MRFNSHLGMPFGADLRDFPLNITLDSACMLFVSLFSNNPSVLVNVQWLTGMALASATMTYSLLRFQISSGIAIGLGVVYALQPYGFYRGISHLHSMYYLVPLLATGGVELALGRLTDRHKQSFKWYSSAREESQDTFGLRVLESVFPIYTQRSLPVSFYRGKRAGLLAESKSPNSFTGNCIDRCHLHNSVD